MSYGETALAEALARQGRCRLRLEQLRALWRRADPIAAAAEDAHVRFRQELARLEQAGVIVLPSSPQAWDRSVSPALPRSVSVAAGPRSKRASPIPTAWVPELNFAAAERHPATLDALRAINAWLKISRGRSLPVVPVPERSLEIFGDEKRLDGLRDGDALFDGRLTLAVLACRQLPPLLVWHPGQSTSGTVLVVENAAAFDSFRRFNDTAQLWHAVVWGSGNAFRRHHAALSDVFAATGARRALYFGDLDPKGIEILAGVMRERPDDLRPHRGLYAALTSRRLVRRDHSARLAIGDRRGPLHAVLPEIADAVAALWSDGMVLPQEGFGSEALLDDPAAARDG